MPGDLKIDLKCAGCGRTLQKEMELNTEFTFVAIVVPMCPVCTQQHVDVGYAEGYQAGLEALA